MKISFWIASRFRAHLGAYFLTLAAVLTAALSLYALQRNIPLSLETPLRNAQYIGFSNPQVKTVQYATAPDGTKLFLDVWIAQPRKADTLRPAIVKIHGGGWVLGARSENTHWNTFLNRLGYHVFDIDYRLPPPQRWKDEVADVKCALGWVAANAAKYGVDPKRISTFGASAGGNLAMLAAYSAGDPQLPSSCGGESIPVKSVVNLYGPTDLTVFYRSSGSEVRSWMHRYIGGSATQYPERYRIVSPITYVGAHTPPTITILGRADRLVPLEQAKLLEKALTAAGVPHETFLLPSADHGFDDNLNDAATRITREIVKTFLQKNG